MDNGRFACKFGNVSKMCRRQQGSEKARRGKEQECARARLCAQRAWSHARTLFFFISLPVDRMRVSLPVMPAGDTWCARVP